MEVAASSSKSVRSGRKFKLNLCFGRFCGSFRNTSANENAGNGTGTVFIFGAKTLQDFHIHSRKANVSFAEKQKNICFLAVKGRKGAPPGGPEIFVHDVCSTFGSQNPATPAKGTRFRNFSMATIYLPHFLLLKWVVVKYCYQSQVDCALNSKYNG